jgi:hypothetical protein
MPCHVPAVFSTPVNKKGRPTSLSRRKAKGRQKWLLKVKKIEFFYDPIYFIHL